MEYWLTAPQAHFPSSFSPLHTAATSPHGVSKNTTSEGQDKHIWDLFSCSLINRLISSAKKKKYLTDVTHYIVDKPMPSNIISSWMFPNNLIIFPVVFQTLKLTDCLASSSSLSQHFIFLKTFVSLCPVHPPVFFRQSTALPSQQAPQRNVKNQTDLENSSTSNFLLRHHLPILWWKILSKVNSPLSSRYFCITLRILKEKKREGKERGVTWNCLLFFNLWRKVRWSPAWPWVSWSLGSLPKGHPGHHFIPVSGLALHSKITAQVTPSCHTRSQQQLH